MPKQRKVPTLNYFDSPRDPQQPVPRIGEEYQALVPDCVLEAKEVEDDSEPREMLVYSPGMEDELAAHLFADTTHYRPLCHRLTDQDHTFLEQIFSRQRISDVRKLKSNALSQLQMDLVGYENPNNNNKYDQTFSEIRRKHFPSEKWTALTEWYYGPVPAKAVKEVQIPESMASWYEEININTEEYDHWAEGNSITTEIPKKDIPFAFSRLGVPLPCATCNPRPAPDPVSSMSPTWSPRSTSIISVDGGANSIDDEDDPNCTLSSDDAIESLPSTSPIPENLSNALVSPTSSGAESPHPLFKRLFGTEIQNNNSTSHNQSTSTLSREDFADKSLHYISIALAEERLLSIYKHVLDDINRS